MQVLVTGGGGFLGEALCRALLAQGHAVRSLARGDYPQLAAAGIECVRGSITESHAVDQAASGCELVFHVAAKAGIWGDERDYEEVNIGGTRHVLEACQKYRIPRLIYTSSPSVVYSGHDEEGIDESTPYPTRYLTPYPRTKAIAEREVLVANSPSLATVALRPHLIWGPGDQHLLPRLVTAARAGRLRRIGDGRKLVDTTYIDNAVSAHLAAMDRLQPGAACAGKAYFIANDEPVSLWELIDRLLATQGVPPIRRQISPGLAYAAGAMLETVYRILGRRDDPPMTRFVARQLSTAHWYSLIAARRDLGYQPQVSIAEGLRRLQQEADSRTPSEIWEGNKPLR